MLRSWKIGRAFGIPLYLHATLLLLPVVAWFAGSDHRLFPYLFRLTVVGAVFGCVLLHELGHALMARRYGIRTRDITLYVIGGIARLERMSGNPDEEILVALAGPAVNVAFVLLLAPFLILAAWFGVWPTPSPDGTQSVAVLALSFAVFLFGANLGLALFNLLPAFPMDGGRVLRAFLTWFLGPLRATEIAANLGLGVSILFGCLALFGNPFLLPVAVVVALAGQQELAAMRRREAAAQPATVSDGTKGEDYAATEDGRGAALPADQPMAPPEEEAVPVRGGFTGLIWDRDAQVWVRWQDGRPVTVLDG